MHLTHIPFEVKGHVKIEDDLGNVMVDQDNAVHPQNMARVISRALSNENNYKIHRIAFGNGGTEIDAAFTVTFKTPNDGQPPDTQTWESRLYNETYSEIVDDSTGLVVGSDPGSSGPRVGTRAGGGARPENDPASVEHVSGPGVRSRELGLTSEVVVVAVLNPSEPSGQIGSDQEVNNLNSTFTFDELGLFTSGKPAGASAGTHDIDVSDRTSTDVTNLVSGLWYDFNIVVDGGTVQNIRLQSPSDNPTFGALSEALNNPTGSAGLLWNVTNLSGATVAITDTTFGTYPSIEGIQTFGFLRFTSGISGNDSSVVVTQGSAGDGSTDLLPTDLLSALPGLPATPVPGSDKGVQNIAISSTDEQERLLTHLIFSPVLKAANRTLTITYTLTVAVARTQ